MSNDSPQNVFFNHIALFFSLSLFIFYPIRIQAEQTPRKDFAYLDWLHRDELNSQQRATIKAFCSGSYWLYNAPATTDIQLNAYDMPLNEMPLHVTADSGEFIEDRQALFNGNVWIRQGERNLFGDFAQYHLQEKHLNITGNVSLRNSEIVAQGDHIEYSHTGAYGTIINSEFSIPKQHLRGHSTRLTLNENGLAELEDASITYCEPGSNDWSIAADEMHLNLSTGRGEAWHARLNLLDAPIFYLPYYQFPIDDRRLTGFLNPEIRYTNSNSELPIAIEQFSLPLYFNIAPNYDDTFTASYYQSHGWLMDNEFRYLNTVGRGDIAFSYLADDSSNETDRWYRQWQHSVGVTPYYLEWDYTEVSDNDYPEDFGVPKVSDVQALDQLIKAGVKQPLWQGHIKAHSYQSTNPLLEPENHPFRRLPEIAVTTGPFSLNSMSNSEGSTEIHYGSELLLSRFIRGEYERSQLKNLGTDKALVDVLDANRVGIKAYIDYQWQKPWGFVSSRITGHSRHYEFSQFDQRLKPLDFDEEADFSALNVEVKGGLNFDRFILNSPDSNTAKASANVNLPLTSQQHFKPSVTPWIHSLEPELYLTTTTFSDQSKIPLYDTSLSASSYAQLLSPNEYIGWDRISDTGKIVLGITNRLYNPNGEQIIRASIGQGYIFKRSKVTLSPEYRSKNAITAARIQAQQTRQLEAQQGIPRALNLDDFKTTPIIGELEWQIFEHWHLLNSLEFDPNIYRVRQRRIEREQKGADINQDPHLYSLDGWSKISSILGYHGPFDRIINFGFEQQQQLDQAKQDQALGRTEQQLTLSAFIPFNDWFAVFGQYRYDLTNWNNSDSNRPGQNQAISDKEFSDDQNYDIIESLVGIEYQTCCWRLQLSYQEETNNDRTKDYAFFLQIHLKGLGILGKNSDDLLSDRIRGYHKRVIHDY